MQKKSSVLPACYDVEVTPEDRPAQITSQLAQKLADLCIQIYLSGGQRFVPLPPFILIRVLPKDMVSEGGIVLPGVQQNKPVHEGIVLETYRPYEQEVVLKRTWANGNSEEYIGIRHYACDLKPGDRIAYPFYEGVAHKFLGDDYMLIRQSADQIKFPYCQVLAKIDYEGDRKVALKLKKLLSQYYSVTTSGKATSMGGDPTKEAK